MVESNVRELSRHELPNLSNNSHLYCFRAIRVASSIPNFRSSEMSAIQKCCLGKKKVGIFNIFFLKQILV